MTLFQSQWEHTKEALLDGLETGSQRENMGEVLELLIEKITTIQMVAQSGTQEHRHNMANYNKVFLPISRRLYPRLKEEITPQQFVDKMFEWVSVETENGLCVDGDSYGKLDSIGPVGRKKAGIDQEAENMCLASNRLETKFNELAV